MRTMFAILFLGLALPAAAQSGREFPDCAECYAFIAADHAFTVTPCGGDPMPVIDVYLEDDGNFPIEVIASDIWLDSPGDVDFCRPVVADSSTFHPDAGHTTFSGVLRGGLITLSDCAAVRVDIIAIGWVIGGFDLHVNSPDLNGDQQVSVADFGLFAARFQTGDACADFDESGFISVSDFGLFAGWFESCVCAP